MYKYCKADMKTFFLQFKMIKVLQSCSLALIKHLVGDILFSIAIHQRQEELVASRQ